MNKTYELGSVNKSFLWEYKREQLVIQQSLKASNKKAVFTKDEVEKIINYIGDEGPAYLANDLGKIVSDREKPGVGKFIYDEINNDLSVLHYVSHLMAVFLEKDIIEYYGHTRDLTFALKRPNYINNLK